jgi:hypothetical protein
MGSPDTPGTAPNGVCVTCIHHRRDGCERSRKIGRQPGFELHVCDVSADFRPVLRRRSAARRLDSEAVKVGYSSSRLTGRGNRTRVRFSDFPGVDSTDRRRTGCGTRNVKYRIAGWASEGFLIVSGWASWLMSHVCVSRSTGGNRAMSADHRQRIEGHLRTL